MRAPKQVFWVEIVPGGFTVPYGQLGGGEFSTLAGARGRALLLAHLGVLTQIYETQEIKWVPVND